MDTFRRLAAILSSEFDKYVLAHPKMADKIPPNALIVFQLEGNRKFNRWSRELAERYREKGQPTVLVCVKDLQPAVSRLVGPKLKKVAI